jgi:hypothetical protein
MRQSAGLSGLSWLCPLSSASLGAIEKGGHDTVTVVQIIIHDPQIPRTELVDASESQAQLWIIRIGLGPFRLEQYALHPSPFDGALLQRR